MSEPEQIDEIDERGKTHPGATFISTRKDESLGEASGRVLLLAAVGLHGAEQEVVVEITEQRVIICDGQGDIQQRVSVPCCDALECGYRQVTVQLIVGRVRRTKNVGMKGLKPCTRDSREEESDMLCWH